MLDWVTLLDPGPHAVSDPGGNLNIGTMMMTAKEEEIPMTDPSNFITNKEVFAFHQLPLKTFYECNSIYICFLTGFLLFSRERDRERERDRDRDRERDREREREKDKEKGSTRSPSVRKRSKSPRKRRVRPTPRYMVHVPKIALVM